MTKLVILFLICSSLIGYAQEKPDSLRMKSQQPGVLNENIRICAPSRASLIQKPPLYVIKYGKKEHRSKNLDLANAFSPNDIEAIQVLKNKKETAEFGEDGKNGVIIITLKKDKISEFKKNLKKYEKSH